MRDYPAINTISTEDLLEYIVNERKRDKNEISEIQRLNGYQSGFYRVTQSVSADTLIGKHDYSTIGTATGANITFTLDVPDDGQTHLFKNKSTSTHSVIIDGNAANIDGAGTLTLTAGQSATLVYFGGEGEWSDV